MGFFTRKAFIFGRMVSAHLVLTQSSGEDAQVEPFQMHVEEVPEHYENTRYNRLGAVRHLGSRDHASWQEAGEHQREPDDEPADTHDPQSGKQEPVSNLLLEVVFPISRLFFAQEKQVFEHLAGIAQIFGGDQHIARQAAAHELVDDFTDMVNRFYCQDQRGDVVDLPDQVEPFRGGKDLLAPFCGAIFLRQAGEEQHREAEDQQGVFPALSQGEALEGAFNLDPQALRGGAIFLWGGFSHAGVFSHAHGRLLLTRSTVARRICKAT